MLASTLFTLLAAGLVNTALAMPAAAPEEAKLEARTLPSTCQLDSFAGDLQFVGTAPRCIWNVCGQNNQWRPVRDCGVGGRCVDGHPTTCVDRLGNWY